MFIVLAGCQTTPRPIKEYSIARVALDSARSADAPRHSPGFWHQAEEAYRRGQLAYRNRNWSEALDEFTKAKLAAEKAENSARLIRQKSGEVL